MSKDTPLDRPAPTFASSSSQADAGRHKPQTDACASLQAGDNSAAEARADLQSRVTRLRSRLEPLMRTIDGEVEVRISSDGCGASDKV
jgi:hypothetical protein